MKREWLKTAMSMVDDIMPRLRLSIFLCQGFRSCPVFSMPLSKFSCARQPSSFSSLVASIA